MFYFQDFISAFWLKKKKKHKHTDYYEIDCFYYCGIREGAFFFLPPGNAVSLNYIGVLVE